MYEKKIIGGIVAGLVTPSEIPLHPSDFEDETLGEVLTTARQLESEGVTPDAGIIAFRLMDGFLNQNDFELMGRSVGSVSVVVEAVEKVKARSLKVTLKERISQLALADQTGPDLLRDLKGLVDAAEKDYASVGNSFVYLADLNSKMKGLIDDLHQGVSYAVPTGYKDYDELICDGYSKGDEHIIVGFTGAGKSAFALNCAVNQAREGKTVGIVSREMADTEMYTRLLANVTNIPRYSIRKGMTDFTKRDLDKATDETAKLRIAFDTSTTNVEDLRPKVRQMVERDGMEILYVDYLQLMTSKGRTDSRAGEVQTISRTLKMIAMENRIPVVSLCQFNRGAMQASLFDILGHLKESSGIEQDASTISYVQVEKTEDGRSIKDAKVTILKNRNGATFQSALFVYDGPTFRFTPANG